METVKLGNSDLRVSRICFGCEPLGGVDWGFVSIKEAKRAACRAYELGINFFDTADVYGLGRSEEMLADALGANRSKAVIATKFGVGWSTQAGDERAVTFRDASPGAVVKCLEDSLRRLRIDQVPLYQLHWPDPKTRFEDTAEALARCVKAGKIRYVGVCNLPPAAISEMSEFIPLVTVQMQYSILEHDASAPAFETATRLGIGKSAYGCLAQGLLTGKYSPTSTFLESDRRSRLPHFHPASQSRIQPVIESLKKTALLLDKSMTQLAIRWVLDMGIDVAVVGAKTPEQVEQCAASLGWKLPPLELTRLTA